MSSIKLTADSGGGTFEIKAPSSSANTRVLTLPDSSSGTVLTTTSPKTGNTLQVVQTVKTDTTSYSSASSFADISGMSVTITPSSNSSKILIIPDLALGSNDMANYHLVWRLLRGSSAIAVSTSATTAALTGTGGMHRGASGANAYFFGCSKIFLDSPATTSATTYKCQWSAADSSATLYLNRRGSNTGPGGISTITAMEVAG